MLLLPERSWAGSLVLLLPAAASDYSLPVTSSVSGKIAFVTGGASGIGAAWPPNWSARAPRSGSLIVKSARRRTWRDASNSGTKAHAIELDVRSYPSFERAVAEAVQQSGRIDYLFNNAGIELAGEVDSHTLEDCSDVGVLRRRAPRPKQCHRAAFSPALYWVVTPWPHSVGGRNCFPR